MPGLNIGIDLGTSTVTAFAEGKGIVLSEATAISYDSFSGDIIAIGNSAMDMTEKAPDSIVPIRPIKNGVISDFSATVEILRAVMEKVCRNIMTHTNCGIAQAFLMASRNPARVIGLEDEIGTIEAGKLANLVFVDDMFNVQKVILGGKVWQA